MKRILQLAGMLAISLQGQSQADVPYLGKINWVSGYAREISGENISYFSAYPDYATTALLTRCTNGQKAIEWEIYLFQLGGCAFFGYKQWLALF
jgi:alpha-mannosidase